MYCYVLIISVCISSVFFFNEKMNKIKQKKIAFFNHFTQETTCTQHETTRSAPIRLIIVSSIRKSAAPVSQRSRVQILYKPEFLSGFLLATAKVVSMYKCNCDLLSYNSSVRSSLNDFHMFISSSYVHNAEQESYIQLN